MSDRIFSTVIVLLYAAIAAMPATPGWWPSLALAWCAVLIYVTTESE